MILNCDTISSLRSKFGDAFYLLDSKQFESNFSALKSAFASYYPNFNIAYSYKTNYIPKLCKIVNRLGGYAEVVSEMELELALRCGVQPERIIWNGPVKNPEWVERLLLQGGTVNVDSIDEMRFVCSIADENQNHLLNVGIRCNFDVGDGVLSRFGFDVNDSDFKCAVEEIAKRDNVKLINLQCHFAKRQIDYWPARANGMLEVLQNSNLKPERIDIGGGLFGNMPESLKKQFASAVPSYADYASAVASVFAAQLKDESWKPELLIEPGSALVGDCMKFVCTIKTIKHIRGKVIATALGSQKNISMAGVTPPFEVIPLGKDRLCYDDVDIVGYTCIEGDKLIEHYSGELGVGDAVVISNCGSYSIVMKPPFILPNFPVLDICDDTVEVIKRAETFDDVFGTYEV